MAAGFRLWAASLALTGAWIGLYLVVVDQRRWSTDLTMTGDLLRRSITHGIVPGLAGGPWAWDRWAPASPWATPPPAVRALGWLVLAAALAVSLLRKRRVGLIWLAAAGYAVACQVPIYLMRSSRFTALELAQTLRYFPIWSSCWRCWPRSDSARRIEHPRAGWMRLRRAPR
ncbi:transmembrane domain protein [Mycobacterium xenopi 3993]|nr:transmembrane domain protein [Mycobacterium xenopi 3993]